MTDLREKITNAVYDHMPTAAEQPATTAYLILNAVMEVVEAEAAKARAYTEGRVELARKAEAAIWERRIREQKEEGDAIIAEEQARVRELEEENQRMRDTVASRIVEEERAVQRKILKDPTNPSLSGLLVGLQRARDIARQV